MYGLLGTLLCRIGRDWRAGLWAVLAASAYGVSDEFHQSFVPGRSVEVADWMADTLGAALAVSAYWGWAGYRRALEWTIWPRAAAADAAVARH
ncbi:MAG: VanZ family protein [Verrucomicrobia bacterium]|nr:VanZ family protein [Verrucomicrobiota bacterium]